jgi:hypothetical protein
MNTVLRLRCVCKILFAGLVQCAWTCIKAIIKVLIYNISGLLFCQIHLDKGHNGKYLIFILISNLRITSISCLDIESWIYDVLIALCFGLWLSWYNLFFYFIILCLIYIRPSIFNMTSSGTDQGRSIILIWTWWRHIKYRRAIENELFYCVVKWLFLLNFLFCFAKMLHVNQKSWFVFKLIKNIYLYSLWKS